MGLNIFTIHLCQKCCHISWGRDVLQFWPFSEQMSNRVIPILTAPAKANICRTLNQKGRIMGFHALWYAQEMTHAATTTFSLYFVILEFLQWVISIYHVFFLTWAPLFQYLVCLQKHTAHFLQLKVTFVKNQFICWDLVSIIKVGQKNRKNSIED